MSPKSCGGSHKLSRTYTLVDPSRPSLQFPTILHIFANTIEEFPQCVRTGDVMRCIDVKVDLYNGYPKLIGSDRNRSSFVLFSKKANYLTGFSRLNTDSNANTGVENDRGFPTSDWTINSNPTQYRECPSTTAKVLELSAWSEGVFLQSPLGEKSMCELSLGEVLTYTSQKSKDMSWSQAVMGGRCDVTCMVAAIVQPIPGTRHGVQCSNSLNRQLHSVIC
jgi:Telomeric single stranded DNA binding POT1/CDC13